MMFSWIPHKDFVISQVVSSKLRRNHGLSILSMKNCPQNDLIFSRFLGKSLIFFEDSEIKFSFWFFLFYCIGTYFHSFNDKIGISWKKGIFFVLKKSTFSYIISTKMEKFGFFFEKKVFLSVYASFWTFLNLFFIKLEIRPATRASF